MIHGLKLHYLAWSNEHTQTRIHHQQMLIGLKVMCVGESDAPKNVVVLTETDAPTNPPGGPPPLYDAAAIIVISQSRGNGRVISARVGAK